VTKVIDAEGTQWAAARRLASFRDRRVHEIGCGDGRFTPDAAFAFIVIATRATPRQMSQVGAIDSRTTLPSHFTSRPKQSPLLRCPGRLAAAAETRHVAHQLAVLIWNS
jgi:hypothetical protein